MILLHALPDNTPVYIAPQHVMVVGDQGGKTTLTFVGVASTLLVQESVTDVVNAIDSSDGGYYSSSTDTGGEMG